MRLIDADAIPWTDLNDNPNSKIRALITFAEKVNRMPTIEERKTGKWVGIKEYCDYLNENAEREGKGSRYMPSGMNSHVYCNQCWEPNDRRTTYCPNCGADMREQP